MSRRSQWWAMAAEVPTREAVLTGAVAITLALSTAVNGSASGAWRDAVKAEAVWNASAVELLRHTYEEQAPLVLDVALAEERSRWLDVAAARAGPSGEIAEFDATTLRNWAFAQRQAQVQEGTLFAGTYRAPSGAASVAAYLADQEAQSPALQDRHPAAVFGRGDAQRSTAEQVAALTIVWVLLFFLLEAVYRRRPATAGVRSATRARRRQGR